MDKCQLECRTQWTWTWTRWANSKTWWCQTKCLTWWTQTKWIENSSHNKCKICRCYLQPMVSDKISNNSKTWYQTNKWWVCRIRWETTWWWINSSSQSSLTSNNRNKTRTTPLFKLTAKFQSTNLTNQLKYLKKLIMPESSSSNWRTNRLWRSSKVFQLKRKSSTCPTLWTLRKSRIHRTKPDMKWITTE